MRQWKFLFLILAIPILAVVGYAVMQVLFHVLPLSKGNDWLYLFITVIVIGIGLAVPYWMMQAGFGSAHVNNPDEKSIRLDDLPKDQRQIRQ